MGMTIFKIDEKMRNGNTENIKRRVETGININDVKKGKLKS